MAIKMDNYGNVYNDELFHYGKKGMKWGKHIMAQEKYWITGNGRNLGGDVNSRMASDSSGIQWKRTVAPSGGFKPSAGGKGGAVAPRNTRVPMDANTARRAYAEKQKEVKKYASGPNTSFKFRGRDLSKKVVPTSNPGVKGVNTTAKRTSKNYSIEEMPINNNVANMYRTNNAAARYNSRNMKAYVDKLNKVATTNTFRSSVQKKASKALGSSISSIQKDQSGLLYKAKKTVNRIFKKISKFFGW